jgi:hypothetical protein
MVGFFLSHPLVRKVDQLFGRMIGFFLWYPPVRKVDQLFGRMPDVYLATFK